MPGVALIILLWQAPNPPTLISVTVDGCWQCDHVKFEGILEGVSAVLTFDDIGNMVEVINPLVVFPNLQPVVQPGQ